MPPEHLDIRHDSAGEYLHVPIPAGYALSFTTATNSTSSGIQGAGRIVNGLLTSAGRRLESVIDRFAEQRLGWGPNAAATRLISAFHDLHIQDPESRALFCKSEYDDPTSSEASLANRLIWVCNGFCKQCHRPYLKHLITNLLPEQVSKPVGQMIGYLRTSTPLPNITQAAMFLHILAGSHIFSPSLWRYLGASTALHDLINSLVPQYWAVASQPDAITVMQGALRCLNEWLALVAPVPSGYVRPIPEHSFIPEDEGSYFSRQIWNITKLTRLCVTDQDNQSTTLNHDSIMDELARIRHSLHDQPEFISRTDDVYQHLVNLAVKNINERALICKGHSSWVSSVAFAPNSTRIASGSVDGFVRIWDLGFADLAAARLKGNKYSMVAVAFSPDGESVAFSGPEKQVAQVWNIATGRRTVIHHTNRHNASGKATSLAFSPDGTRLISGSESRWPKMWNIASGHQSAVFGVYTNAHGRAVTSVAFSSCSKYIVSGSADGSLCLWDSQTGWCLKRFRAAHTSEVSSVAFSHDGASVASGSHDNTVQIWSVGVSQKWQSIGVCKGHILGITSVTYSPADDLVASGSLDKTVRLWDPHTFQQIAILEGHSLPVLSISYSPDGRCIVSGSKDNTMRLWDVSFFTSPSTSAQMSISVNGPALTEKRLEENTTVHHIIRQYK